MSEQNNGNERVSTPLRMEAIEKETRAFVCPSCGDHLQFLVRVQVVGVVPSERGEDRQREGVFADGTTHLHTGNASAHARLVQHYRDSGLLDAFERVTQEVKGNVMPKSVGSFFINWLKASVKAQLIPRMALHKLIGEFGGNIEVWHCNQIAAVVSDGELRCFMPMHILRGEVIRAGGGSKTSIRTQATEEKLTAWIKTKYGYVVSHGAMFQELQKRAKGSFELTERKR